MARRIVIFFSVTVVDLIVSRSSFTLMSLVDCLIELGYTSVKSFTVSFKCIVNLSL